MAILLPVIYEDENLLAINKPAGVVVNRAESVMEPTVQDWVEARNKIYEIRDKIFRDRSGICHRLDKETSGVLVIAKNPETLREIMRQFKDRETQKEYVALVHGKLEPREGWFRVPIKRKGIRVRKFGVDPLGKMAETSYQVEKTIDDLSLVTLWPKTGRTHQLRVHLSFYKHPIVADSLYCPEKLYKKDKEWCPRHFLHAQKLTVFNHTFVAPLPEDLRQALNTL